MTVARRRQRAALRAEIVAILGEGGNAWMSPEDIAAAVNERGNCRHPEGAAVTVRQICRQTRNYANLFERTCAGIRLREPATEGSDPAMDLTAADGQ